MEDLALALPILVVFCALWLGSLRETDEPKFNRLLAPFVLALAPRTNVSDVRPGKRCKVVGAIVTDQALLTSPSGQPCVWYRLHAFHYVGSGDARRIVTDLLRERAIRFRLQDATGAIEVETADSTLAFAPNRSGMWLDEPELRAQQGGLLHGADAYERARRAAANADPGDAELQADLALLEHSIADTVQYHETVVLPHDQLVVYGPVLDSNPRVIGGFQTYVGKRRGWLRGRA